MTGAMGPRIIVGGGWTPEKIERLKALWTEGASCSQIANQLGGGVTRNSVIGKVRRLGLPFREVATGSAVRPRQHRSGGARSLPSKQRAPSMRVVEAEPEVIGPVGDFPPRGHCKWTKDDPLLRDSEGRLTFRMCGQKTGGPLDSWCEHHRGRLAGRTTVEDRLKSVEARRNTGLARAGLG